MKKRFIVMSPFFVIGMAVNTYFLLSEEPVNAQSNTGSNHPFDRIN